MFLKTYAKWIDGDRDAAEMARLEMNLQAPKVDRQAS